LQPRGSRIETLIETAVRCDAAIRSIGASALDDQKHGKIYWSQKGPTMPGVRRIFRANVEIPAGETPANRSDIEVFFGGLPEPIASSSITGIASCTGPTAVSTRGNTVTALPSTTSRRAGNRQ